MQNARPSTIIFLAFLMIAWCATSVLSQSSSAPATSTNVPAPSDDKAAPVAPAHRPVPGGCSYMPNPPYTKEARDAKVEGRVLIEATVGLDGKVTNMRVLKALGYGLDESAMKTLEKWKCTPAIGPEGKPVPVIVPFQISFRLRRGS